MPSTWMSRIVTIVLIGVLGALLIGPIVTVVQAGFVEEGEFSLYWLQEALSAPREQRGLINSLWLATLTTALCLAIAIPLALIAETYNFAGKRLLLALLLAPLILPPFVGAIGLKGMLSRHGGLNSLLASWGVISADQPIDLLAHPFWACVVLEALSLYPIAFLNIQAALANIDLALDQAAANLGAGAWRRFWAIRLPLMRPGIFAGATIVFIWTFTEIGTPLMVGFNELTAVQVFDKLQTTAPEGDAYAQVVVLLVVSVLLYLVGRLILGRGVAAMQGKATTAAVSEQLSWWAGLLAALPFAVVIAISIVPHIGVVLYSVSGTGTIEFSTERMTLQHYAALLQYSGGGSAAGLATQAIINSLYYSVLATGVNLVAGFAIAYLVVRRRSWLTVMLDGLAMLPLAAPGLVLATGWFAMTQGGGWLSSFDPIRGDPTALLVMAYAVRRLPFLVRSCAAGLEQTSEALEEASYNLGASWLRTMLRITAPLLAANFIAGALLTFSRSMLEVSDSLILAFDQPDYPITKAIWSLSGIPQSGLELAAAMGVVGMLILLTTLMVTSLLLGKKLGALFRV